MDGRFLLTGNSAERIRDTIRTVESMVARSDTTLLPTRFSEGAPQPLDNFRIGTFGTAAWSINSSNTVTLTNVGVTGYTVLATNIFGTITAMGSTLAGTTRPCAVAKDGTAWYLIQPVPSTGGAKAGTFTGGWGLGSDKEVTSIVTGEVINVTNLIYSIPDTGETMSCVVVQEGTAWQLANVQHLGTSVLTKVAIEGAELVFSRAAIQVIGQTSSPTSFPLSTCNTYSGSTVAPTSVAGPSGVSSFSSTSFFLG
jgi:hypothetical protein